MFKALSQWLDARTGYKSLIHEALEEPIPGGAKWKYVFGSALTSTFLIQLVTGILLMFTYSPSSTTAWGSVYYISNQMTMGWFVRGIHHFGSQAMIVLLAMHLIQVLIAGAYRSPREVNWWFGMSLLFITVAFSLTGYLLPWDQKGYWATKVATNIAGGTPILGAAIQKLALGGSDYGNQTLTRFYGLHVGVLPGLLVMTLAGHIALFRKHGVTASPKAKGVGRFWPEQVLMDIVASLAVLGVLVFLVVAEHGANLDAPADPSSSDYPARPEWYFLSLFQMLKLFPGELEVVGTIIIPGAIVTVLMLLPLFDKILPGKIAHFLACVIVFALVGAAGYLTYSALKEDANNPAYQVARANADTERQRALFLAGSPEAGIPPEGPAYVLLRDPLTHGRAVLEKKCLSCHYFDGKGQTIVGDDGKQAMSPQVASDLNGFGTYTWIRGLLENPSDSKYFGKVAGCGGMAQWKAKSKLTSDELDKVAAFVTTFTNIPDDLTAEEWIIDPKVSAHPGVELFSNQCGKCHVVTGLSEGGESAPGLFGWGSSRWTKRMIQRPGAPDLYGFLESHEQMPSFSGQLTENDLETLVKYLKHDYPKSVDKASSH